MWTFLGFIAFCNLICPLQGVLKEAPPGVLVVVSPAAFSKYISTTFLRNKLIQSHIQAIQFPSSTPAIGKELGHWIQGLHVVKVYLPIISVRLETNATAQLHLKARLHLSAQYHFGRLFERIDAITDVHFVASARFRNYSVGTAHLKYEACDTRFTLAQIICPSYLMKTQVKPLVLDILKAALPGAVLQFMDSQPFVPFISPVSIKEPVCFTLAVFRFLCQAVQQVGNVALFDFLYTANVLVSVHSATTLQYQLATMPQITPDTFAVKLNIWIRTAGRFLVIPASDHPIVSPLLKGSNLCLLFSQDALNAILPAMVRIAPQEFITRPQVFSGSIQLINAVAVLLSHHKCPTCPEKSPLKILLKVVEPAVIVLHPSSAHLQLAVEIAVAAKDPLGAIIDLFVLKANLKLSAEMSVHGCKLIFRANLMKVDLFVIASDIGHISVNSLSKWIHLLLVETFMPRINDCLNAGLPVPSLLNIKMDYAKFLILQGSLALCV